VSVSSQTKSALSERDISDADSLNIDELGDGLSLLDLMGILIKRRYILIVVTLLSALMSATYVFNLQPSYRATAYFLPLEIKDFIKLNTVSINEYKPRELYLGFQVNFKSRDIMRKYFDKKLMNNGLLKKNNHKENDIEGIFEEFSGAMRIVRPSSYQTSRPLMQAIFEWKVKEEAEPILKEYLQFVSEETENLYIEKLRQLVDSKIENVQKEIGIMRKMAELSKGNYLVRLDEGIAMARKLGLKKPMLEDLDASALLSVTKQHGDEINPLLYRLGYAALEAERNALESRVNNDPYISGIEEKLAEVEHLRLIQMKNEDIGIVHLTQDARLLPNYIKPDKQRFIVISTTLGFFVAIIFVFISYGLSGRRSGYKG